MRDQGKVPAARCRAPVQAIALALAGLGVTILVAGQEKHSQEGDRAFDPRIERPAYDGEGPAVCIDEAHDNFHTMGGRYSALAALLRHDGYRVVPGTAAFTGESLKPCRLLVISNARGRESPEEPAFAPAEIEAVDRWVRSGGSLLLIADHAPFGAAAGDMGEAFGVGMLNGYVKDPERMDAPATGPYILRFGEGSGLNAGHPISQGRTPEERVRTVVTFGGQALRAGGGDGVLLFFSRAARSVLDPRANDPGSETPVPGWAHAVALDHGQGRAVIAGEAALFTAQVIEGPVARAAGVEVLRVGMTREDTDNQQFVLNTVHWLSGLL